ncbi:MAG: NAD(P)-binding domain-containing protein [Myxococcales bacterium]
MAHYDLLVVGAGPAGISTAIEARAAGVPSSQIIVLEKGPEHSYAIRRFYPEGKRVDAVYKGLEVPCEGQLCISDGSKQQTLDYLDQAIRDYHLNVHHDEGVDTIEKRSDGLFEVRTTRGVYEARVVVVAIGILGRPNQPAYKLPKTQCRGRIHFDVTATQLEGERALVVGGGDSAADYVHFLVSKGFTVDLSYRGTKLVRMNPINLEDIEGLGKSGRLSLLMPSDIVGVESDDGRPRAIFQQVDVAPRTYDQLVYALGGSTPAGFLHSTGIQMRGGEPVIAEGGATNVPGLFLTGDLTAGGKGGSIITAFNSGVAAMRVICRDFLDCQLAPPEDRMRRGDGTGLAAVPKALGLIGKPGSTS